MMRKFIVAGTVLALAAGMTTSTMASDQKAGKSTSHVGRFHAAASDRHYSKRGPRLAGVRGRESWYPGGGSQGYQGTFGYQGAFIDLGPLGMTAACGANPHRYDYCGPRNGAPIDAWGR
jgi:uncharacterized membrane protein